MIKLLIPLDYLNESCNLSENIDDNIFKIHLRRAQIDLKDILGYEFYNQISDQYDPNSDTFSTDNATLYEDYIKDYLAWRTYFYFLGFSQSASTPTGEREFSEENSTILSDVKLWSKEKNVGNVCNQFKYEIINFLRLSQKNDSTKYSLWVDNCEPQISFAISSISRDKRADQIISIDKATSFNE